MARPELGTKRICGACGGRFYDFGRSPIVCPKCGTVYTLAAIARPKAAPVKAAPEPAVVESADEEEADVALVSLEDADADEALTGRAEPDIDDDELPEVEDDEELDAVEADEFLPEDDEEDGDDVTALIDGDIVDDEET